MTEDRTTTWSHGLQALILEGDVTHTFTVLGYKVVLRLFPAGVYEEILLEATGGDDFTRMYRRNVLSLAHALRSVGDSDFDRSLEEKKKFVRALSTPLQSLFIEELLGATAAQAEAFKKRHEELKKVSPNLG